MIADFVRANQPYRINGWILGAMQAGYAADNSIGPRIVGSSFSGLLTREAAVARTREMGTPGNRSLVYPIAHRLRI
jgi:hypothetical protein